jgi:uncharacterized membrane protein (DUF485 family)
MQDYIRRTSKFLFYLAVIFVIVLKVIPLLTGYKPDLTLDEILHNQRMTFFLAILIAYSLVYPFIAYVKVRRNLNGSFKDNQEVFDRAFEALQYIKTVDTEEKIVYRKKSGFVRFLQWYEDSVVITPQTDPVIISGPRKSVTRINMFIDHLLMSKENSN